MPARPLPKTPSAPANFPTFAGLVECLLGFGVSSAWVSAGAAAVSVGLSDSGLTEDDEGELEDELEELEDELVEVLVSVDATGVATEAESSALPRSLLEPEVLVDFVDALVIAGFKPCAGL